MDVSLLQMALEAEPSSQSLPLSLVTIKSLLSTVIDVLIEQQLPATLVVKLPPIKTWQAEIDRYQQQSGVPQTTYLCNTHQPLAEKGQESSLSQTFPISLPYTSHLKWDYFFLVFSEKFCSVILATRSPQSKSLIAAKSSKKRQIPTLFDSNPTTVKRVLQGIKQALLAEPTPSGTKKRRAKGKTGLSLEGLLARWDALCCLPQTTDPAILNQLTLKQVQQQEETWHLMSQSSSPIKNLSHLPAVNNDIPESLVPTPPQDSPYLKEEFLSHLVQELRMPLTNMKTALSLLDSPHVKVPQRQRYLQLLNTECDRQNSLISSLLELLQLERTPEQTDLVPLHLSDIVPSVVSIYQPLAQEKGIQLGYTVPDNLPPVSCSETWLKQIVINLLHNSIKYTPKGGQVSVRATRQSGCIQLEFRDTGMGIAHSEISKIFDRFYRGRLSNINLLPGAGLGLTIVQQLLIRCGGSISVTSKPGEGSNFKVLLPVHQ